MPGLVNLEPVQQKITRLISIESQPKKVVDVFVVFVVVVYVVVFLSLDPKT